MWWTRHRIADQRSANGTATTDVWTGEVNMDVSEAMLMPGRCRVVETRESSSARHFGVDASVSVVHICGSTRRALADVPLGTASA